MRHGTLLSLIAILVGCFVAALATSPVVVFLAGGMVGIEVQAMNARWTLARMKKEAPDARR